VAKASKIADKLRSAIKVAGSIPSFANPLPPLLGSLDGVKSATAPLDKATKPMQDAIGERKA
jgi:hypothetical protein